MKIAVIGAMIMAIAIGGIAFAQSGATTIEIRVWERADDPTRNYVSARADGAAGRTSAPSPWL